MLDQVDAVIRTLLMTQIRVGGNAVLTSPDQVGFQPPDDEWRTSVANLGMNALNVYLVDLRENLSLGQSDWIVRTENGLSHREPAPARVDCHYLISAWSPATVTPATSPTLDEHQLLYQTLAVLRQNETLNPTRVYPPGSVTLATVDPLIRDSELPTHSVPAEGWPKTAEFWGAMGADDRWKPSIWYRVTVPVALTNEIAAPPVTTRIIQFQPTGHPETAEWWAEIGGHVTGANGPIAGATISIAGPGGTVVGTAVTAADGAFAVAGLHPGNYEMTTAALATAPSRRPIAVPDRSGSYDVSVP